MKHLISDEISWSIIIRSSTSQTSLVDRLGPLGRGEIHAKLCMGVAPDDIPMDVIVVC